MNKKKLFLIGLLILVVLSVIVAAKSYATFTTMKTNGLGNGHFGELDAMPLPEITVSFTEDALTVGQKAEVNLAFDDMFEPKSSETFFNSVSSRHCGDVDSILPYIKACAGVDEKSEKADRSFKYDSKFTISEINFLYDLDGQTIKNTKGKKHSKVLLAPLFFDTDIKMGDGNGEFNWYRRIDNEKLKFNDVEFKIECEAPGQSVYGFIAKIKRTDKISDCKKVVSYKLGTGYCDVHKTPFGIPSESPIIQSIKYEKVPDFEEESIIELKTIFDVPIPCTHVNGLGTGPETGGGSGGEETPGVPPTDENANPR